MNVIERAHSPACHAVRTLLFVAVTFVIVMLPAAELAWADQSTAEPAPSPIPGLPPAEASDPVVVAAGDIACSETNRRSADTCQQDATAKLVLEANPTAVLTLGDSQYECGKLSQFKSVFDKSWGKVKDRIYPVPGNHEYNRDGDVSICADEPSDASGYYDYFGAAANPRDPSCTQSCDGYYSFDLGSWHLIALNSNCDQVGGCEPGSPQEQWLRADLAAHPASCTLAYWHHPRFSSGKAHGNQTTVQGLWSALHDAGAELVLAAHEHNYERFSPMDAEGRPDSSQGMRQFVVGTGGRNLYDFNSPVKPTSEARASTFGVLRLGLHDGWYDWTFLAVSGQSFTDTGTGTCHDARGSTAAPLELEAASGMASPTPSAMPSPAEGSDEDVLFADTFEQGSLEQWGHITGFTLARPASGSYVLRSEDDGTGSGATGILSRATPDIYASIRFNLREKSTEGAALVGVATADGSPIVSAGVDREGILSLTNGSTGESVSGRTPIVPGMWHDLQLHVRSDTEGLHTEVWYDGVYVTALKTTTRQDVVEVGSIQLGDSVGGQALQLDVDDIVVAVRPIDHALMASIIPQATEAALQPQATPSPEGLASQGMATPSASPAGSVAAAASPVTATPGALTPRNGGNPAATLGQPDSGSQPSTIKRVISSLVLIISMFLTAQGFFTLGLMLYTWARTDRLVAAGSPTTFAEPTLRFTALLPARHEREVIAHTVHRVWNANYPKDMLEVVVVCEQGDVETIEEAERAAREIGHSNVRVVTFSDGPINKPHGLNVAFRETLYDVVTIFDAEDDVHPDVFNVANTVMLRDGAGIVQAGVQLMDFQSTWFAVHNVLEYFFWFKSRLHFHAQVGMVPLGGNTVFIRRPLIERVGGWDEQCLTEDADIGIRLSTLGERITITYDAEHATREETPPSLMQFIKQRTRWNQGFLQVMRKGTWKRFPKRAQRMLAAYTLTYPFTQALFGLLWVPALIATFALKLNIAVAMLSLLPLYALVFQFAACLLGLFDFARAYRLRVRIRDLLVFTISFLPYQILLSLGAIRAVYRAQRGRTNWEKTAHTGAHRAPSAARALEGDLS